ncbi:MAG: glycosyltransferase [Trueperaceae bacterium]|nr:glycosyltransferase [Trueperaceae bacterium]
MIPRALEVAVVHHRTPTMLARCLEALARHAPDVDVRVVDTAFDPSLPRQLDGIHPRVTWTAAPNHSLAAAVNAALRLSRKPFLVHMNADVFVAPRTLADLLAAALADERIAMAGPLARTPAGHAQDLGVPYRLHYARLRWQERHAGGEAAAVDVPWLSGCMQLVRMSAVRRVGGMDASLRFYNEDLDWSLRLRRAGFGLRLVATEVVHEGGASTPSGTRFLLEGLRGGFVVSRRYTPPVVRAAHRLGVLAAAEIAARTASDDDARTAWREVARRFRSGELERSAFGPTLSDPS